MKFARGRKLDNSPDIISPSDCINLCTQRRLPLAWHAIRENEDNRLANTNAKSNTNTNTNTNAITNTNTGSNTAENAAENTKQIHVMDGFVF